MDYHKKDVMSKIKRSLIILAFTVSFAMAGNRSQAQSEEIEELIMDIEKLAQLKQILSDMYKGYKIVEGGYTTIRDLSKGSFNLHKAFLDGLLAVSPAVKNYYKVAEIINYQLVIVKEYKQAYSRFKQDNHFLPDEIIYMGNVYNNLFDQSVKTLNTLITILTDGQIRASDDERMKQIDGLHADMLGKLSFLRQFDNNNELLSLQRSRTQDDVDQVKKLYGITN